MMPVNLHGNVFDYTASGFKNAWRIATQRLRIEDLHFHDLRHEAISRFFELGSLNVMEIAAISGHRSMNMLKRYTHLRAWQLVSKLDARRRQTQKVAAWFVPYPAHITTIDEENGQKAHRIEIGDFDNLHVTATTKEEAVHRASEVLLRTLAIAAQKGERVPSPGALPVNDPDYIMICPLNPGSTPL
ncbi:tyrosine-type recombinase/integrase, partial [Escherichia coli]|nr:tyrosine-type recombinase/integrase [Escherichia coli]HEO9850252.1 tyrosine-type recombinase/integrase [Klebsiella pneumoniae subsp. pneumoniae]EJQ2408332.1 tyrosine-type recombinase/integrase [Escherichia coli]ELJ9472277.1 tyrosine-type recombinase/integrase [Escherichia coli]ELJ9472279.1 tyrosine-type recombinase/integrase [Escherichia coli]